MSIFTPVAVPELQPAGTEPTGRPRVSLTVRAVRRLGRGAAQVALVAIGLWWLVPTLGLAVASLRSPADNSDTGWWTVLGAPTQLTLRNYQGLVADGRIIHALWNTVLISVPSTVLVVAIAAAAAYPLAWLEFRGRHAVTLLLAGLIAVPVQMAVIPDARLFRLLGLSGTIPAVVAFHVAFGLPFAVFLLRNFYVGIPSDLIEAARIDGGSEFAIFRRIVLPMGKPALASLAVFQFVWVWNDLIVALVFARSDNAPITSVLQEQMRSFPSNIDVIAPGALVSMAVPLLVFFLFQRFFLHSMIAGSVR
ncbi:carbohydrate ABC transporter permease [Dactylosporangium fulvum]|uniref:Carbohydrate ABC transporter permease n=1 Tax=Dactylosporangium fulvum TaxID=53359 RepID=A0ABY5VSY6_9ACTN|nr:carbohydrate ABC transporter permease [Dactylosporangium fulvum]UWP79934.1 carbohydrate ABC transporter permease [Dactylosporangium fulvum]